MINLVLLESTTLSLQMIWADLQHERESERSLGYTCSAKTEEILEMKTCMSKLLVLLKFGFMKLVDKNLEIFDGGRSTYINSFEHSLKKKNQTFPFSHPPTQHRNFFFFIETKHLLSLSVDFSLKCYFIIGNNKKNQLLWFKSFNQLCFVDETKMYEILFFFWIALQIISDMKNGVRCCKQLRSKLEEKK